MTIERYMAARRYWETAGWVLLLLTGFLGTTGIAWFDTGRYGLDVESWELIVAESTSHVAIGLLIPVMLWFDRRFPITIETWRRGAIAHLLFTMVWSLAHVALMYWGRVGLYQLVGDGANYHWDNWLSEFGYEYVKDFRSYFLFLAIIYLYRFILRRIQGEAGYLAEGKEGSETSEVKDRFLIKKLGREFLVRVNDIDWVESSGNYVNLHVGRSVYPLRETMNGIGERLVPLGFQRVHRSAIVNLDRISEIVPFDTGDGEAHLRSGVAVPVSRRYRKELRDRLE